jgi:hypothetical protein
MNQKDMIMMNLRHSDVDYQFKVRDVLISVDEALKKNDVNVSKL